MMSLAAWCLGSALILVSCAGPVVPVTLAFPDFPENVASMDLGQRLTIDVSAANDSGAGVTWKCTGDACAPLKTTPASATFKASGITGKAVITATSKKQTGVSRSLTITVVLNESPDMICR